VFSRERQKNARSKMCSWESTKRGAVVDIVTT